MYINISPFYLHLIQLIRKIALVDVSNSSCSTRLIRSYMMVKILNDKVETGLHFFCFYKHNVYKHTEAQISKKLSIF